MRHVSFKSLVFLTLLAASLVQGFLFDLDARTYKCFKEELPNNFDVYGEYEAMPGINQVVDFRVTDSQGKVLLDRKELSKGDFSFVTKEGGEYTFCFFNRLVPGVSFYPGMKRRVSFDILTGTETYDYESLARKEHLKPVEVNLRMMEDIIKSIHNEYVYFHTRENAMKGTNDSTHSRVQWLGFVATFIMIASALWQVWYLKTYFQQKKII